MQPFKDRCNCISVNQQKFHHLGTTNESEDPERGQYHLVVEVLLEKQQQCKRITLLNPMQQLTVTCASQN